MISEVAEIEPAGFDVMDWILRAAVAVFFASFGLEKIFAGPQSYWIPLFAAIGLGQWFRYVTAAIQLLGAALVLVPRTALAGAALLGSTMVGAILLHLFWLGTGAGAAVIPAIFLGFVVAAARRRFVARSARLGLR